MDKSSLRVYFDTDTSEFCLIESYEEAFVLRQLHRTLSKMRPLGLLAFALMLGACSSLPEDQRSDVRDPYEDANRSVFAFNMAADTYVLEPVADGYRTVAPNAVQRAVTNHVEWASLPSTAVNSTLQGKFENATLAVLHFAINGLTLGLVDLTEDDDQPLREDFGQTLAAANVPEGSYIEVPLLGGHTTRSLTGRVVDFVLNPLSLSELMILRRLMRSNIIALTLTHGHVRSIINSAKACLKIGFPARLSLVIMMMPLIHFLRIKP